MDRIHWNCLNQLLVSALLRLTWLSTPMVHIMYLYIACADILFWEWVTDCIFHSALLIIIFWTKQIDRGIHKFDVLNVYPHDSYEYLKSKNCTICLRVICPLANFFANSISLNSNHRKKKLGHLVIIVDLNECRQLCAALVSNTIFCLIVLINQRESEDLATC